MELVRTNNGFNLLKIDDPKFNYVETKWSTERQKNVDAIAEEFMNSPNTVKVLSDNKLGNDSLVFLKKSKFEGMLKLFRDLGNGQAHIQVNIETILSAISILQSRIQEQKISDTQVNESLKILARVSAQINSEILVSGVKKGITLSEVTEDELAGLPRE